MLLPEDLCNRSPGFSALVIQEETPSTLPVSCLTDGLTELTRQLCLMEALVDHLILLLSSTGGPSLPGGPSRLGVPDQTQRSTLRISLSRVSFALQTPNIFERRGRI